MIHLFKSTTSKNDLIQYNGDFILDSITTKAIINEDLNGVYELDLEILLTNTVNQSIYDMLVEGSLIKIDDEYGYEYFRIAQVIKNRKTLSIFARHITISDILTMWLEDVRPENRDGNGAINYIFDNATTQNIFTVSSDIRDLGTAYYQNKNVYEALFTADNSFLERWGGEVYRRGFTIQINSRVGSDKGVSIRSRKNLTGLEVTTNINNLATRLYPKGYDGITIEERYVDSPLINSYARIYSKEVKFDDIRVNDENYQEGFTTLQQAQEEMKYRCRKMFENNGVDKITASYRVNFVQLEKTEEYKNYSILETTWLGDTVNVYDEELNIDISVRVTGRTYDCLKKERTSTTLSNKDTKIKPITIKDVLIEIGKIPAKDEVLSEAKQQATALINSGMTNSHVIVRQNEILIMDTKDINTAKNVWRFNEGGLGFSNTGYYGEYGLAMTKDGQIVADRITTGELNGSIIKANSIQADRLDVETAQKIANSQSEEEVRTTVTAELGKFKVEINNDITEKMGDYYNKTETKSLIETTANNISLEVARNEIENLQIGGVNLYDNTKTLSTYLTTNVVKTDTGFSMFGIYTNDGNLRVNNVIDGNGWYTVSFEARINNETWGMPVEINDVKIGEAVLTTNFAYFEFTHYVENYTSDVHHFVDFEGLSAQKYEIRKFKVERGQKATDYSPSFVDINNSIAKMEIKADEIINSVSETYTTKDEANKTYSTKSELSQTVTDFTFKLQNSGGYNLIRNGNALNGQTYWRSYYLPSGTWGVRNDEWSGYVPCFQINNQYGAMDENVICQEVPTTIGKTYTASALVAGHRAENYIIVCNGGGTYIVSGTDRVTNGYGGVDASGWKRISTTFVATETTMQIRLSCYPMSGTQNNFGWFKEVQVEEGVIVTNYTPNPEEVYTGITKIDKDGITVTHSADGSYSRMSATGMEFFAEGSGHRYHNLMKQGWIDTISFGGLGSGGWAITITLPPEFKNKPFSVIPSITYIGCPHIADAIKMFEINVPHNEVDYVNGTFRIYIYASGLWAEGLAITYSVEARATWIAIA